MNSTDEGKRKEGQMLIRALSECLLKLKDEAIGTVNGSINGYAREVEIDMSRKIGSLLTDKMLEYEDTGLLRAIMEC